MPRTQGAVLQNNFIGGLKTEFTGLNFPTNAVTETYNCVFGRTGKVSRRLGINREAGGVSETLNRTGSAITSYTWTNASGDGVTNLLVLQTRETLSFYKVTDDPDSPSSTKLSGQIDLTTFEAADTAFATRTKSFECQYAQGQGYLFVFHPYLDPFYVSYNPVTDVITATVINILARDFEGITSDSSISGRPASLSAAHNYNLLNQGWASGAIMSSATSVLIATGSTVFTVSIPSTAGTMGVGDTVAIASRANLVNGMFGIITAYSGTTLTVNVTAVSGAGTFTDWTLYAGFSATLGLTDRISVWFTDVGNYPSNSDVWWYYKNASDEFDPATTFENINSSGVAAPKGHFLVNPFFIDRTSVSGISGLSIDTTFGIRPSTGEFFQNRIFYGGVQTASEHATIYFSQTLEDPTQFGKCYQANDPTTEQFFDLLPTDGGVVTIQNAGSILRLYATKSSVIVFTTRGIWSLSGSQAEGLGFTANDFTVVKLSSIKSLLASNFVDFKDNILWWNLEGIYSLALGSSSQDIKIESLTDSTIATFYQAIPNQSKTYAKGVYNPSTFIVQWLFRSTEPETTEQYYEFDRVLNLNTITGAFYPWSIDDGSDTGAFIHGIQALENAFGTVGYETKYIYSAGGDYSLAQFSFGEERDTDYEDWAAHVPESFDSYFITGYNVGGDAQRKFQAGYINVFSEDPDENGCAYSLQGIWDWAGTGDTGKYTSKQVIDLAANDYSVMRRRLLLRGQGLSLQLKFESVEGRPFHLIGWSSWVTANQTI